MAGRKIVSQSVWKLLQGRHMCRNYRDQSVPRALLLRVLEAARKSPSAGHSQGFRLAVVTNTERRAEIAELFGESHYRERGFEPWLSVAPVHLIAATSWEAYEERYAMPDKQTKPKEWKIPYPILDAGKSLMALYLAAQEVGLSCGFLGSHAGPDLVKIMQLPEDWKFVGLLTLGYRSQDEERPTRSAARGWREFDDVVRWIE